MIRYRCDGCGIDLARDGSNHFIIKIEAFAAAGKTEFTQENLRRDHQVELNSLTEKLEALTPDEIEDQVYRALRFDLCPGCHRKFLGAPLAGAKSTN